MPAEIFHSSPHAIYRWCDDDANPFELRIVRASDGDFHICVVPTNKNGPEAMSAEAAEKHMGRFAACFGASVRVRMPMIGGGMHEHLWSGIADLIKNEEAARIQPKPRNKG